MTIDPWTQAPEYTISGIGPYGIPHPYRQGAIVPAVRTTTGLAPLSGTEFTVTPLAADTDGDLYLSPTTAATYAGLKLVIDRVTPDEQGWVAVLGEREAGLAAQLDYIVQAVQEVRAMAAGAVRIRGLLSTFDWPDGTVPMRDGDQVVPGPTVAQILAAADFAAQAAADALAAAASSAAAQAKENSMLRARGTWGAGIAYTPSDIARQGTIQYRCLVPHTSSGSFATDLGLGRWEIWLQDGAPGVGAGNVLASNNLSELTNKPLAWATLGGGDVGKVNLLTFALIDSPAVRVAAGGFASLNDIQLATPAWVQAFLNARSFGRGQIWQDVSASRTLGTDYQNTTDRPIKVRAFTTNVQTYAVAEEVSADGVAWLAVRSLPTLGYGAGNELMDVEIPPGHWYRCIVTGTAPTFLWRELR